MTAAKNVQKNDQLEAAVRLLAEQLADDPANALHREQGAAVLAILDGTDKTRNDDEEAAPADDAAEG